MTGYEFFNFIYYISSFVYVAKVVLTECYNLFFCLSSLVIKNALNIDSLITNFSLLFTLVQLAVIFFFNLTQETFLITFYTLKNLEIFKLIVDDFFLYFYVIFFSTVNYCNKFFNIVSMSFMDFTVFYSILSFIKNSFFFFDYLYGLNVYILDNFFFLFFFFSLSFFILLNLELLLVVVGLFNLKHSNVFMVNKRAQLNFFNKLFKANKKNLTFFLLKYYL